MRGVYVIGRHQVRTAFDARGTILSVQAGDPRTLKVLDNREGH